MSWLKWLRGETGEALACSFCGLARAHVHKLVSGGAHAAQDPRAYICNSCIAMSVGLLGQEDPRAWVDVLLEIVDMCPPAEAVRLGDSIARAASALAAGHTPSLRTVAERLAKRELAVFSRAACNAYRELLDALTLADATHAVRAALLAGDLEAATTFRPAAHEDLHDRSWLLLQHQVALVRAPAGSAAIAGLLDAVVELHHDVEGEDPELVATAARTAAYAHVRVGQHATAVRLYSEHVRDPQPAERPPREPWHRIAIGDAFAALGQPTVAQARWRPLADDDTLPYWQTLARERLAIERVPYR